MTRTHAKETRMPPVDVDLEALFAFDTETLVKLASTACGKQPESIWDSSREPGNGAKEPKADSEMRKLIEQKDKQIEVLKKTVCDLLVWKARNTDMQLQPEVTPMQVVRSQRGAESITTRGPDEHTSSEVALPLKRTPMRADAPEFVSLGIPLLVGSPKSTPEVPKKTVSEQRSERDWRSFRAGRSPPPNLLQPRIGGTWLWSSMVMRVSRRNLRASVESGQFSASFAVDTSTLSRQGRCTDTYCVTSAKAFMSGGRPTGHR